MLEMWKRQENTFGLEWGTAKHTISEVLIPLFILTTISPRLHSHFCSFWCAG